MAAPRVHRRVSMRATGTWAWPGASVWRRGCQRGLRWPRRGSCAGVRGALRRGGPRGMRAGDAPLSRVGARSGGGGRRLEGLEALDPGADPSRRVGVGAHGGSEGTRRSIPGQGRAPGRRAVARLEGDGSSPGNNMAARREQALVPGHGADRAKGHRGGPRPVSRTRQRHVRVGTHPDHLIPG